MVDSEDAGSGEAPEGRHPRQVNKRNKECAPRVESNNPQEEEEPEPGPLGLRLTKSPSLIHLIETRLSHENSTTASMSLGNKAEKMKASKFAISLLRIGCWECEPKHENDLVAKFYFARKKLVWEVFDGSLKNKIEILWSNIMDIKARFPEDGPGTLNIVLAKQPHFFREIEPKPGKQSLWQPSPDFTGGQASTYRIHFIQCPQGEMDSHFYNLIKCDQRLNSMSCLPEKILTSPFFETSESVSGFSQHSKDLFVDQTRKDDLSTFSGSDLVPLYPFPAQPIFEEAETPQKAFLREDAIPHIDPCNGDANCEVIPSDIQANGSNSCWDSFIIEGLHPSMALGDLIIHQVNYHLNDSESPAGIDSLDATTVEAPQVESWDGSNGLPHPVFAYPCGEEIGGEFSGYNGDCAHGGLAYDQQQQPPLPDLHKDEDGVNHQFSR